MFYLWFGRITVRNSSGLASVFNSHNGCGENSLRGGKSRAVQPSYGCRSLAVMRSPSVFSFGGCIVLARLRSAQ